MKTSNIATLIATLSFLLFMSVASDAKQERTNTGDFSTVKTKKQKFDSEIKTSELAISNNDMFNYLRFDVSKFINENETIELPVAFADYIRFNVADYTNETEIKELPLPIEFEYLRFDVNNFIDANTENVETPENDFDYLRFDVTRYSVLYNPETENSL